MEKDRKLVDEIFARTQKAINDPRYLDSLPVATVAHMEARMADKASETEADKDDEVVQLILE